MHSTVISCSLVKWGSRPLQQSAHDKGQVAVFGIEVSEGSRVDKPLEVHDDLCADEICVSASLLELRELVLEEFVETSAS